MAVPEPSFATQAYPLASPAIPQGLTRLGSVFGAGDGRTARDQVYLGNAAAHQASPARSAIVTAIPATDNVSVVPRSLTVTTTGYVPAASYVCDPLT